MARENTMPPGKKLRDLLAAEVSKVPATQPAETPTQKLKRLYRGGEMERICVETAQRIRAAVTQLIVSERSYLNIFGVYPPVMTAIEGNNGECENLTSHSVPLVSIALAFDELDRPSDELSEEALNNPTAQLSTQAARIANLFYSYYEKLHESLTTEAPCAIPPEDVATQILDLTTPGDGFSGVEIRVIQTIEDVLVVLRDPHDFEVDAVKNVLRRTIIITSQRDRNQIADLLAAIDEMSEPIEDKHNVWHFLFNVKTAIFRGKDLSEEFKLV